MRYKVGELEYSSAASPFTGPNGNKRTDIITAILFAVIGGEKCRWCGSTERVQFDHINPKDKRHNITHLIQRSIGPEMLAEVLKCQPLCHVCHVMKSSLERSPRPRRKRAYRPATRRSNRNPEAVAAKAAYDKARNLAKKASV